MRSGHSGLRRAQQSLTGFACLRRSKITSAHAAANLLTPRKQGLTRCFCPNTPSPFALLNLPHKRNHVSYQDAVTWSRSSVLSLKLAKQNAVILRRTCVFTAKFFNKLLTHHTSVVSPKFAS